MAAAAAGGAEETNPYRAIGVSESASQEEVDAAVRRLKQKYAGDEQRLEYFETQKARIFDDKLRKRLSGAMGGASVVRESPYERRQRERAAEARKIVMPRWVKLLVRKPELNQSRRAGTLLLAMLIGALLAPTISQTSQLFGAFIAGAFLYNRGLPEPVKDDYGNIGEVRPVKSWPLLRSLVIVAIAGMLGLLIAYLVLRFLPLPLALTPDVVTNVSVFVTLWLACSTFYVQDD